MHQGIFLNQQWLGVTSGSCTKKEIHLLVDRPPHSLADKNSTSSERTSNYHLGRTSKNDPHCSEHLDVRCKLPSQQVRTIYPEVMKRRAMAWTGPGQSEALLQIRPLSRRS